MFLDLPTSVAPKPRLGSDLGSARILSKKLGSARAIFQKARIEKIGAWKMEKLKPSYSKKNKFKKPYLEVFQKRW